MAAVQATIPFKVRKKTYARSTKSKANAENIDILNTRGLNKTNKLKRRIEDDDCNFKGDLHNGKQHVKNI